MRIFRFGFGKIGVECPPQRRTIITEDGPRFLSFPYITFVVGYRRNWKLKKYPVTLRMGLHDRPFPNYTTDIRCPASSNIDSGCLSVCMGNCWPEGFYRDNHKMAADVISLFWQSEFKSYDMSQCRINRSFSQFVYKLRFFRIKDYYPKG